MECTKQKRSKRSASWGAHNASLGTVEVPRAKEAPCVWAQGGSSARAKVENVLCAHSPLGVHTERPLGACECVRIPMRSAPWAHAGSPLEVMRSAPLGAAAPWGAQRLERAGVSCACTVPQVCAAHQARAPAARTALGCAPGHRTHSSGKRMPLNMHFAMLRCMLLSTRL